MTWFQNVMEYHDVKYLTLPTLIFMMKNMTGQYNVKTQV